MRCNTVFLLLQARVVDDHRDTERHHEQHRQRQQASDQGAHQRQGQRTVEPDQLRTTGVRELGNADFAVVDVITGQVQFTQTGTLAFTVHIGNRQDRRNTGQHRRNHRHENVGRIDMQRTGRTGSRAAPGRHVHHATGKNDQAGHDPWAHADAAVERQHGGHADHISGRAVTIKGNDERQNGGADRNFQRVALDQLEDLAHGRVEQAGVDHQGKIKNCEHQHHPGRGKLGDAFEHHRTDLGSKATEQGEQDRDDDQGNQRGQALGHDQEHERDDHGKAKESQHRKYSRRGATGKGEPDRSAQDAEHGTDGGS